MRFDNVTPDLLARCRSGDSDAFEELCVAVQHDLYGLIFSMLRDHDDTDEVLQECLVRVYRHLGELREIDKFPWWLMRMAVNQAKTLRSRSRIRRVLPLEEELEVPNEALVASATPPHSPRQLLASKELAEQIHSAVRQLPERQRMAIVLYEIEQLSVAEVAKLLRCSEGAVKFNLHEGRKKLKVYLKDYMGSRAKAGLAQ